MRIRSGFSFKTAVGHLDEVVDRLAETGRTVATISDRGSTFAFRRFRDACKKKGLKVGYGVEIGTMFKVTEKKPIINYFTFFAKESISSINELVRLSTIPPTKEPVLFLGNILDAKDVIKIIGERITLEQLPNFVGEPDTYMALSPSTPRVIVRQAIKQGIPLIAVSDNYYTNETDLEFYRVALGRRANTQTYAQHILSDEEWKIAVKFLVSDEEAEEAIKNRELAFSQLNADLVSGEMFDPESPKPLFDMCVDGANSLGINLDDSVYSDRLAEEIKIIKDKGFESYFYIVADIMQFARSKMVVGPGRGSSGGSLVCYLLGITAIDPIKYNTLFFRFLDPSRNDMPDIDLDFDDQKRSLVFDHMQERYGRDHVARLGTVGFMQQRSALKAVGAALKIPIGMIEKAITASGDVLSIKETFDTTEAGQKLVEVYPNARIAERLEGHPANASQHAAGMLVTKNRVIECVATDERTGASHIDKVDAEILNLLKIDALGLTQLSIFDRALSLIGVKENKNEWLSALPLDDPKAFDVLNEEKFSGIFQFAGRALQGLTKEVKVESLEDIISITALARPGPMESGGAGDWVKRRSGREPVTYTHPLMEEITKDTYGLLVFQEQVMMITRKIGNMSWEDTSAVRRAIGKSLGHEALEKYYDKFRSGAAENGVPEHTARKIWNDIVTFGRYGFNRSHAVSYGIVSYYCCYLKAHYPVEFAAASLDAESDSSKQLLFLRELKQEGIDYINPDATKSTANWEVTEHEGKRLLLGPLTAIKGLGPKMVREIMEARNSEMPIRDALKKRLDKAKTEIDTLYPIRDAARVEYSKLDSKTKNFYGGIIEKHKLDIGNIKMGEPGSICCIGVITKIRIKDENDDESVQRRGGTVFKKDTQSLNIFIADDTGDIFAKVNRFSFKGLGEQILEHAKAGSSIYLLTGTVPSSFRMLSIQSAVYLGEKSE